MAKPDRTRLFASAASVAMPSAPAQPLQAPLPIEDASPAQPLQAPLPIEDASPALVRLGDTVIVRTATAIAGRYEHAAIVTSVHGGEAGSEIVDVLLMPRTSEPYPVLGINPESAATSLFWRPRE